MITLKQFDTARYIEQTLTLGGSPVDLTNTEVYLVWFKRPLGPAIARTAEIVNAAAGMVKYKPIRADVVRSGEYWVEWRIKYPDGTFLSVPTRAPIKLVVTPALT